MSGRNGGRWSRRRVDDESVEGIEDRLRHLIPVRDPQDGSIAYRPAPTNEDMERSRPTVVKDLPRIDPSNPRFVPHSDWEPVFRKANGEPVAIPRAVKNQAQKERFERNSMDVGHAWTHDQGWVWSIVMVFVLLAIIVWVIVANWSWWLLAGVIVGGALLLRMLKKYGVF